MMPLKNPSITSEYGVNRSNGKLHKGLDIISSSGDRNVRNISRGKVRQVAFDENGWGNYVVIQQDDGYRSIYAHLQKASVKVGERVEEGKILGIEGTTGNSTGVHLHLELRKTPYNSDSHINVAQYLYIKNMKGVVKNMDKEDYKKIIQEKAGIDDNSIKFLEFYRYGKELIEKLAKAMI